MPDGQSSLGEAEVLLSETAVQRLRVLAGDQEHEGLFLRVAVNGGGCSGFQYSFTFDDQINPDDRRIERDGVTVVIDSVSWDYLSGSTISYREELIGSYFSIENPNAASTCGCGTSFSLF